MYHGKPNSSNCILEREQLLLFALGRQTYAFTAKLSLNNPEPLKRILQGVGWGGRLKRASGETLCHDRVMDGLCLYGVTQVT